MRRRRSGWFSIVATDLFSGAFAAIILLDTVSPKELGSVAEQQEVRISYSKGDLACPADPGAIVFSFLNGGDIVTTLNGFGLQSTSTECAIVGFVDVYATEIDEPCILVAEFAGV
ncbi:MAG: hypothetical protein ACK4S3_08680, partial [Parvibaculum sp.]